MSRRATYDTLGEHFYLAFKAAGLAADWFAQARCRGFAHTNTKMRTAWQVTHGDTVVLPSGKIKGAELIRLALGYCEICPVQWDCATRAVTCGEQYGTWAMPIEDLKLFQKRPDALAVLELARAENVSVQEAVAVTLRRKRT